MVPIFVLSWANCKRYFQRSSAIGTPMQQRLGGVRSIVLMCNESFLAYATENDVVWLSGNVQAFEMSLIGQAT